MDRFIEHIVEPHRLLLFWQARESKSRSRFYVGQIVKQGNQVVLKYDLEGAEFIKAKELGFHGYPAFPLKHQEHSHQVLEAFMRRLPPRNRSDFGKYLQHFAINPSSDVSDFALLGYTGAKLPNDGFELVHPFDEPPERFEFLIEIAGFRHETEISADDLKEGDSITFRSDPTNSFDSKAIRIESQGRKLGFVPKGCVDVLHRAFEDGAEVRGEIFRKNGSPDRPLIYVLTHIARGSESPPLLRSFAAFI
uniref:HIRAN domain-containing protein n=1 Tax=Halomonas sp. TaxID=1486246 RepID=UPI002602180E|nr:HIRAN domain-containing protein [Halomonas sp.]